MKFKYKQVILLLVLSLSLVGCIGVQVPANRITIKTLRGSYDIYTPKNVSISKFIASVDTNGVLQVNFDKWTATNDPLVIDRAAAGQVAIINAYDGLLQHGISAAVEAAKK